MSGVSDEVTDEAVNKALGAELRAARDGLGLTRAAAVQGVSSGISAQTLANYEAGIRPMTLPRLVEICEALGVSAASLVVLALRRAGIEPDPHACVVDLSAVLAQTVGRPPLARWAEKHLENAPSTSIIELRGPAIREMAVLLDIPLIQLVQQLRSFAPQRVPLRIVWTATE
jgi:transcriptional regulator with XRE-family HTH domain